MLPGSGGAFAAFRNSEAVRSNEREVWRSLGQFDEAEPLDRADRMRLRELLTRGEVTSGNYEYILKLTRPLGVRPSSGTNLVHLAGEERYCQTLLAKE